MSGWFGSTEVVSREENKIGALRIQNSSQGLAIPIVFGRTRISSNLLWYGDLTAIPHTEQQGGGGKGGDTQVTENTTYTYTVGVICGLMEGPSIYANFVAQVWADKDLTDVTTLGLSQFNGSYSQTPWTYLTTNHANEALAYRGQAYVAAAALDLGSSDGLPNLSFEVVGLERDGDVNTANVVSAMLTSDKFGAGWPAANLSNLSAFNTYCNAAGFAISPAFVAQQPMSSILSDLARIGNSGVIWSDGTLKIIPYADTVVGAFTPDLTVQYDLTFDDFIADEGADPVTVERKRQSDSYNVVRIECLDRSNWYNIAVVEAKDQGAIDLYGLRPMAQIAAHAICDPDVARRVAQAILQRELYVRNIYSFTVGWKYGRLEPMDIVSLTDVNLGLVQQAVRIISIEEDADGFLAMKAEELNIGQSTPATYTTQPSGGCTPVNNTPPGNAAVPVIFQPPLALSGKPQIWLGTAGGENWGGADVWASVDNTTFQRVGNIPGPARFGVLSANFPSGVDPDVTNTLAVNLSVSNGVLTSAANEVADSLGTLSYADGELVAYSTANLTGNFAYSMSGYIRRGQAGSNISAHLTGSKFMRLDSAVGKFDVAPAQFGTTIFIKLLSYNTTGAALQSLADVASYSFNVATQVVTSGSGYPYYADRASVANSDPGAGFMRFNNASQAAATQVYFDTLTAQGANMSTLFAGVGGVGFLDLRDASDTNKWATYKITGANTPSGYQVFNVSYQAGGAEFPQGATVVATFSPSLPTGVISVGLNMPATVFNVTNSPVTSNGTLTVALTTQNANLFFAGPSSGNAAVPTFRALTAPDIQSALAGANLAIQFVTANHTLALTNMGNEVDANSSSPIFITVPDQANVTFNRGTTTLITRYGTGNVSLVAQGNTVLRSPTGNLTVRVQYGTIGLKNRGPDDWVLFGDLT